MEKMNTIDQLKVRNNVTFSGEDIKAIKSFEGYTLRNCTFPEGSNLSKVSFKGANLIDCEMNGVKMRDANMVGTVAVNTEFNKADMLGTQMSGATFSECKMNGADMCKVTALNTTFQDVKLDNAKFCYAKMDESILSDCSIRKTDFSNAMISKAHVHAQGAAVFDRMTACGTNFDGSDLRGSRMSDAMLGKNCTFNNADMAGVKDAPAWVTEGASQSHERFAESLGVARDMGREMSMDR